ncbi:MAG: hypothetical protein COT17_00990 [Elusimicrobia bacterium CG08_land_8_20_14_0_20_51_18]|nr:MAG: hypothetical protein COT17_00990 [Elusimicrobia bacterium CG08_land_8_20_14_0_20_51_18]
MKKRIMVISAFLILAASLGARCAGKKIVCVMDLADKSNHSHTWRNVGTGIAEMLVTSLAETKKYTLIERNQLEKVMAEQRLGASGAITAQTAAKVGRLLGAQFIITGAVTEFGVKDSKIVVGGLGKVLPFGGGAKVSKNTARVTIDVRAIDTSSAQIIAAAKGEGSKSSSEISADLSIAPSFDFGKEGFDETVIGKAARKAVDEVAKELSKKFDEAGGGAVRIIKIVGKQIYINSGKTNGEEEGRVYEVYRVGEEMIDPDTGESLGSEDEKIGTAEVVKVLPKYSIAETDASGIRKTDVLKEEK